MRTRRWSLAGRTVAGVMALLAAVLTAFTLTSLHLTERTLQAQLGQSVDQAWERSVSFLTGPGAPEGPDGGSGGFSGRDPLEAPGQPAGVLAVVVEDGQMIRASRLDASGQAVPLSEADVQTLAGAFSEVTRDSGRQQRRVMLESGEHLVQAGAVGQDAAAMAGLPTAGVDGTRDTLMWVQVVGSLSALTLAGLLGWWWIRRSLRPLVQVSQAAARVAGLPMGSGEVSLQDHRVPKRWSCPGDEVGDVGFALNRLIDSVDGAFEQRNRSTERLRTFVADASHELRTPLAAVRGYAEMLRLTESLSETGRQSLDRVLQQSDRMRELVEDLLLLARLDAGRAEQRRAVDLVEVTVDAVTDATAAGRDHTWSADLPQHPLTVDGDPRQLGQLLSNLLSNARKHTPPGSHVRVRLDREADRAVLSVEDDGPGIDPELLPRLFDRFVRADPARVAGGGLGGQDAGTEGSTGLGLSIVRSVARAHGGEARVSSAPGRTVFTVDLPLAPR